MGRARKDVLRDLGIRTGVDDVRALAAVIIQAEKFGSSIGSALRVQSDSMRTKRRQLAEERAAKTAVKIMIPLVLFIFPGVFVVLVGPAGIQIANDDDEVTRVRTPTDRPRPAARPAPEPESRRAMRKYHEPLPRDTTRPRRSRVPAADRSRPGPAGLARCCTRGDRSCSGSWMSMTGTYQQPRDPDPRRHLRLVARDQPGLQPLHLRLVNGGTWRASTAVPLAIAWAVIMGVVFLAGSRSPGPDHDIPGLPGRWWARQCARKPPHTQRKPL